MNRPQTALASIGQFETAATPLQMAMVASAVANDGTLMKPYMVDKLQAPSLDVIEQTDPEEMSRAAVRKNAQILQSMMETVVKEGTGTKAPDHGRRHRRRQDRYRPARRGQQREPVRLVHLVREDRRRQLAGRRRRRRRGRQRQP